MDMDAAPVLMKRKGAEGPELWLDDDGGAPGFPVSSRATKIRRLDAEVLPVVLGAGVPPPPPQPQPQPVASFGVEEVAMCGDVVVPVDVAPAANEERAIVLYRPAEAERNLLLGPLRPGVPFRVSPDWIHGLKNTMLQEGSNHRTLLEWLAAGDESSNSNMAMVPWTPSHSQAASTAAPVTETMDAEDSEGTSMEVDQDRGDGDKPSTAGAAQGEALHQQWPQHCMVQQPLPAPSYQPNPVTWSW